MMAVFHWHGTTPSLIDWLDRCAIDAAKTGDPSCKNQAGIPYKPVAVALSQSSVRKSKDCNLCNSLPSLLLLPLSEALDMILCQ